MQLDRDVTNASKLPFEATGLNFETMKQEGVPKTAAVSHRMKAFCCNVPINLEGRLAYQNSLTQRPGLSPKAPTARHGPFGPSHAGSVVSKPAYTPKIKQFVRANKIEATKCHVTLHDSTTDVLKKDQPAAGKLVI